MPLLLRIPESEFNSPVGQPVSPAALGDALRQIASGLTAIADALGSQALPCPPPLPLLAPRAAQEQGESVIECVNALIVAKARVGRSDRYLRQLRVSLGHFVKGRARRPLAGITSAEVEKWLDSHEWSSRTKRGYLADVKLLFAFAERRGLIPPGVTGFASVEVPQGPDRRQIEIHSPAQVAHLLEFARQRDPDVMRHLALRYFTGIRSAEAHRLREEDILAEAGFVSVPAHKSKTRSRRLVTIQPVLASWLALGGILRPLGERTVRGIISAAGTAWPHNVTRHSFVSYHLAHFASAARTALEAGHSEAMLFRHYRAIATPAAAASFWATLPGASRTGQ